jgi:ADP-ribose pyrophosphatase
VQFPNGSIIEQYHLLDFDHQAVMTAARDEVGRYVMVKVSRYPIGRAQWEFPAGSIEAGEEILPAGERELFEETGYRSSQHELLYTYYPMNGIANQVFHVVRCKTAEHAGEYDPNEISEVRWFTKAEIWGMIRTHELQDGYTLVSFLLDQGL